MRNYYRRKLALRRIIFCTVYTLIVGLLIFYCGDRYSITTSNITNVKSIESNRLKPRIVTEDIKYGNYKYVYKTVPYNVNCLDNKTKIKNEKYNDSTYGLVKIVKANSSYLCNSILKFNVDGEEIYGIILEKDNNQSKNIFEILTTNKVDNSVKEISYTIERYGN